jgi:indole-3-glycerol phosphate synthase
MRVLPLAEVGRLAQAAPAPRDALRALSAPGTRIIAEIKQASPSRGVLRADLDATAYAREVTAAGAAAISVLTDSRFFQGSFDRLASVREAVNLPLLCKDFILTEYQIRRARAVGADLVLLIVAALEPSLLAALLVCARSYGMEVLVEVHDEAEVDVALEAGARIVGVNNRDLRTFETRLETSERLAPRMPDGIIRVSESGLRTRADIERLEEAGYRAFLIGESLVTAPSAGALLRELMGAP